MVAADGLVELVVGQLAERHWVARHYGSTVRSGAVFSEAWLPRLDVSVSYAEVDVDGRSEKYVKASTAERCLAASWQ